MNGGATRRSVLAASAVVPLLAVAGCGAQPVTSAAARSDVAILRSAIAAKQHIAGLYTAALATFPALAGHLDPLLADNLAHLAALRRRLIEPARSSRRRARGAASPRPPVYPSRAAALTALRAAERAAATAHVAQLQAVTPSLAQLLASIAACEATHVAALVHEGPIQ